MQSRCESQGDSSLRDEGLHLAPVDTGAHVELSRAALWPRASGSENMTTAQNGHGRVAAIPCSVSDPTDAGTVTYPACQNGACSSGDSEAQDPGLGPAKFVRLFSASRKRTGARPERPRSVVLMGHSATWNALASFRKMGSFKKLKSSVFQGIQNREGPDAAKEEASAPDVGPALPNGAAVAVATPAGRRESSEATGGPPQAGPASDCSDAEEADDAFQRSTHRSRSLRRAYGLGRISLRDAAPQAPLESPGLQEPQVRAILGKDAESNSVAYRRSKSTDSLNFLLRKSSFKRKSASNLTDLRAAPDRPAPRRTLSSCSADSEKLGGSERRMKRWKSPIRAKDFDRVLRLVSGATDAAWKRERAKGEAPCPSDAAPHPAPPRSRLHDDYSRRASSSAELECRRAGPARDFSPEGPRGAHVDVETAVFPLEAQSSSPCTGSPLPSPPAQEVACKDSLEPKPGSQFTLESEQPLTPLRPTAPKPPSPQSPGTGKEPSSLSALSLSSADSNERAEGPVPFPDLVQATCDKSSEDSGSRSHPQPGLGEASHPEEKEEEVRAGQGTLVHYLRQDGCL